MGELRCDQPLGQLGAGGGLPGRHHVPLLLPRTAAGGLAGVPRCGLLLARGLQLLLAAG